MFVLLAFLCLFCQTTGDIVRYKCSDDGETMKFTPEPNVRGRYTVELCTDMNPHVTQWDLDLWYYASARCSKYPTRYRVHSTLKGLAISSPANCTNVCYSVDFDLIYAACYNIHSELKNDVKTLHSKETMFLIQNNLTLNSYKDSKTRVLYIPHEKDVTLEWISMIPIPYHHSVCIRHWNNHTKEYSDSCYPKAGNCTLASVYTVWCTLVLPPACYEASLILEPAWYSLLNSLTENNYKFCVEPYVPPVVGGGAAWWAGGGAAWWAAGAALAAGALALGALAARRQLQLRDFHKRVIKAWRDARESSETARVVPTEAAPQCLLLLHAREGEHGQRAVAALKQLLQHCFDGQVVDVYSAAAASAAAAAPGAWLRAVLLAPRTKVLLLQSPALHRLYRDTLQHDQLRLCEPLLGRRSMYRTPHFGDQLLLLALRLAGDSVGAHHLYHKYYCAGYAGLAAEALPALVPFRRYELPRAAEALLRDLAAPRAAAAAPGALLQRFAAAAQQFAEHALARPDYLRDELVLL